MPDTTIVINGDLEVIRRVIEALPSSVSVAIDSAYVDSLSGADTPCVEYRLTSSKTVHSLHKTLRAARREGGLEAQVGRIDLDMVVRSIVREELAAHNAKPGALLSGLSAGGVASY